jgi:hypothetical protein
MCLNLNVKFRLQKVKEWNDLPLWSLAARFFFLWPLNIFKSNFRTLVFVLFCQMCWYPASTHLSFPVHHGHCPVWFTWAPPLQWINLELWLAGFSKISSSLFVGSTDVTIVISVQPLLNTLHHFVTCHSLITLLPDICVTGTWILVGETYFTHKNQITLHSSMREQVSIVVAIAHRLISLIASELRILAPSFACYLYWDVTSYCR